MTWEADKPGLHRLGALQAPCDCVTGDSFVLEKFFVFTISAVTQLDEIHSAKEELYAL